MPADGPSPAPAFAESAASAAAEVEHSFMNVRRVPLRPMIESSPDLMAMRPAPRRNPHTRILGGLVG